MGNHITISLTNTRCASCETRLENRLSSIPMVERVRANSVSGKVDIWVHGPETPMQEIHTAVQELGYTLGEKDLPKWFSRRVADYLSLVLAAGLLFVLYLAGTSFGPARLFVFNGREGLVLAALVGLAAGFSSCMATIGGLVLGLSTAHSLEHPTMTWTHRARPHLFFNLGRVGGFALLGGLIGVVGLVFQPSVRFVAVLSIVVAFVMIFLGLRLVGVFPRLAHVGITMPRFLSTITGTRADNGIYSDRGAILSGVFTFFLPCGFTQAMQIYAVSSGSFFQGALIMGVFALGTAPGLFGIGGLSALFKNGRVGRVFFATAGLLVIALGVTNIMRAGPIVFARSAVATIAATSVRAQTFMATYTIKDGLTPREFAVQKGQPTKLEIASRDTDYGCMGTILIPGLFEKTQFLRKDETVVLGFIPQRVGVYQITCAMGLPHGSIRVY